MRDPAEPQGVRFFAWYRVVAYLWVLLCLPFVFLGTEHGMSAIILMYPALLWVFWVAPHLHGPFAWKQKSPAGIYRNTRINIVLMPLFFCLLAAPPLVLAYFTGRNDDYFLGYVSFAAITFVTAVGYLTVPKQCKSLKKRFVDAAHQWNRCYECGYDLRMCQTDACPECGYRYSMQQSESNTSDPTQRSEVG